MIFVTVGAQMPFDRLVRTVDNWAGRRGRDDVYAQIGPTDYRPLHMRSTRYLSPGEFRDCYESAKLIVAHAGTGSIITALELGKPIVIMPRRSSLRETRNDHQIATAERFRRYSSIAVAWDENELVAALERIEDLRGLRAIGRHASSELLDALRGFIEAGSQPVGRRAPRGRIRIAYLVPQYPKVSHTFIRREIAAVEHSGAVEVSRYSLRPGTDAFVDPADRDEAVRTRVVLELGAVGLARSTLHVAIRSPRRFLAALALAVAAGWGSDRGVARHIVYFAEACALLGAFRDDRIEHVHAHFGTNATTIAMLCRELGGPSYSFTIHGPQEFELAPLLALPKKIARAEFVVGVTEFCRSQIWRNCDPGQWEKVHVVTCGVDSGYLGQEPAPVPDAPKLVFVGRLSAHKAPGLLIEAAARLRREAVPFELIFAGDGELRPQLEAAIARHDLGACVRIAGFIDEATVRRYIRDARALVLPSFAEGLPLVLMEALALGRPVVSTFVAGIPELVEPGRSGWLVPAGSLEQLTAALREVLQAPLERLEAMGRVGRARVLDRHDSEKSGRVLAELFARFARRDPPVAG